MPPVAHVEAELGFARPDQVAPDHERTGLLRARTQERGAPEVWDFRSCVLHDMADPAVPAPHLDEAGFEAVDVSSNDALQRALAMVAGDDAITETTDRSLRDALHGSVLRLADGRGLRIDYVADDGLINRRGGPNRLNVNLGGADGRNGHDTAAGMHADQDVFGVPLRKLMDGKAPEVFRHRTPDGSNDESSTYLLNLWIPLQQVTNPLVFMDRRTLDQQRHQLRYGLPVEGFLERDEDERVNDIWKFLPDPGQEFWFRSDMGPDRAFVFDTLGTPHGAGRLAGEEALEVLFLVLDSACTSAAAGDADALAELAGITAPDLPDATTDAIRAAHARMVEVLRRASTDDEWITEARAAMDTVIRKSVEMRIVATVVD